jgi:hypothetical protein
MQLTPGQLDQITLAVREGRHRVSVSLTDLQRQLWQQAAAAEDQGRDETVTRVSRMRAATIRPGLFGDLRRAIALARIPDARLAGLIGVDLEVLGRFREGEVELPADTIERLVTALGLRLMHEIRPAAGA